MDQAGSFDLAQNKFIAPVVKDRRGFPFARNFHLTQQQARPKLLHERVRLMINSERDYSEEIANLCRRYNVKYLGLHGSGLSQEDAGFEDPEINFLVEFFPLEPKQYGTCYFSLEKELQDMFSRPVCLCDLTGITLPEILQPLTRHTTDIYKA